MAEDKKYKSIGSWHDLENLECTVCGFSTVNGEAAMEYHIRINHPVLVDPSIVATAHAKSLAMQQSVTGVLEEKENI